MKLWESTVASVAGYSIEQPVAIDELTAPASIAPIAAGCTDAAAVASIGPTTASVFDVGRLVSTAPSTVELGYDTGHRAGRPLIDLHAGQVAGSIAGMFDWLSGGPATEYHNMRFHLKK